MKRILTIFSSLVFGVTTFAATSPLFFNAGVITNAIPIDATTFLNLGTFSNILSTPYPYDMQNVRFFTNRGVMQGSIGFQFDTVDPTASTHIRRPLASFYNAAGASISAVDEGLELQNTFLFFGLTPGQASYVKVAATNLVNRGKLSVGDIGLMQLTGKSVDLSRGALSAGEAFGTGSNFFGFFGGFGGFFFFNQNSFGVEDIYGGAGMQTNSLVGGLNALGYFPPFGVFSPLHRVLFRSGPNGIGGFTTDVALPRTFPAGFEASCNITQIRSTPFGIDKEIQAVFVRTNFTDTNITAAVRFAARGLFGELAIVQFSTLETNSITGQRETNAVYLLDDAAEFNSIFALTNFFGNNSVRPSNYQVTTTTPFDWLFGRPGNTTYDPQLIYPGNTYEDKDVLTTYAGYGVQVGRNPELASGLTSLSNIFGFNFGTLDQLLLFPDPTNQAGRIEISADKLDLSLARIRSEGLLSLKAKHLAGSGATDVSAGVINADLGSTNGSMVISNIFPNHFKRVRGDIYAYTAIWNNTETNSAATNKNQFHVLIVDHNLKADFKPTVRNLILRSTNLLVKDNLTINQSAMFVTENLTIDGTVTLAEDAMNLHRENLVGVKNFLNASNSVFQGANDAYFGFDTDKGWDSITNRGSITAVAPLFKATRFENSGTITANQGGSVLIQARTASLSNGKILAERDVHLTAGDLTVSNSTLTAGQPDRLGQLQFGQLVLEVTNLLTDLNATSSNFWQVSDGIVMARKPRTGDLLKTEIRTIASGNQEAQHIWAGEDVGAGPSGYVNNVAVGHLILDLRSSAAKLRFSGADSQNALYVVNLDFQVTTNVDINTSLNNLLTIDDNMRIYYINSNAGDKLETAFPGRIVHVDDFGLLGGASPLIVKAKGLGVITPNLDGKTLKIGSTYSMKATPSAGQVFANWSGGTNTATPTLTFKMRRNLILEANFVPNPFDPVKGTYNGLFYDTTFGVKHESSGFITFTLTQKGGITGKLISGKPYPLSGTFDRAGHTVLNVVRAAKSPLTLELRLDLQDHPGQVTGTVSGEHWVATFMGKRAGRGFVPAGKYTLVIPGSTSDMGGGFGTATVNAAGAITINGTLADGTTINQQTSLSPDGQWPFYVPLYNGAGSILSQIIFTNEPGSSFGGDLSWIKTGAGFTNLTSVIGSSYSPPVTGAKVLDLNYSTVILRGGNLSAPVTNEAIMGSGNALTVTGTNGLKVSIARPTGLLTGSFVHPDTRKTIQIKGVVLQQQNNARGFFSPGPNQSGALLLEGN